MKEKTYLLNILLAAVVGLALLACMVVKAFLPAVSLPGLDLPMLTALSLRALGRTDEADRLVASWSTDGPDRRAAWCKAVYQGDTSFVQAFLTQRKAQTEAAPWEVSHPDHDFDLLLHLFAKAR